MFRNYIHNTTIRKMVVTLLMHVIYECSTVMPKLKLNVFALYRPTRKYPADSNNFICKKVFYRSPPFIVLLLIVYIPIQLQQSCKKLENPRYF